MFYRPPADCMEEQRERVSPPQSRPLQETGGERGTLTPHPHLSVTNTIIYDFTEHFLLEVKVLKRGGMYLFLGVVISLSLRFMDVCIYIHMTHPYIYIMCTM